MNIANILELQEVCKNRNASVVRDEKGLLLLMPFNKSKIEEKNYEIVWVGDPQNFFMDSGEPREFDGIPAMMLFDQMMRRIAWKEKVYAGHFLALDRVRDNFYGLAGTRPIEDIQKTIREVKEHLSRLKEEDRAPYIEALKDLLALEEKPK